MGEPALKPGLPPDGAPGYFIGFDKVGNPAVLIWRAVGGEDWRGEKPGWHGLRFGRYPHRQEAIPEAFFIAEDGAKDWDHGIVCHMAAPTEVLQAIGS